MSLVWPPVSGNRYHITVGEYEDGRPGEVWVHGAKFDFITKQHARYLLDEWFREGIVANETLGDRRGTRGLKVINTDMLKTLI